MKRGIKIGDYTLAELLNTGGMGQVWLARREFEGGGQTAVALKFPHAAGVLDPRIREGLCDEARLQMQLQHPNIPRVTDMGVHEGLPYFVMDFIAGRSLAQLLGRLRDLGTPLRFELAAHIAREIGYALRYAHTFQINEVNHQVIHRDVAPKNVLLSGQGGVYVVDFGVSEGVGFHSSRNHIKGTLLYMAPEHALGFPSPKSDGWGLGAILWEMIEGRRFRAEIDPDELRRAANEGRYAPLTRPRIPDALRFVTEGLLRVDERDRLTLDEVLKPLETSEFPAHRSALCDLLRRRFGGSVHRSGQTLHDFKMPEQLDRTIAAARMVKDAGLHLGSIGWNADAFTAAGAPAVIQTSGTRPIPRVAALDDSDDDSKPRSLEMAPASALMTPTLREQGPAAEVRPERWYPECTEPLTSVPAGSAAPADGSQRTEWVPPPSRAPAGKPPRAEESPDPQDYGRPPPVMRTEQEREEDAPVPRSRPRTQRTTAVTPATAAGVVHKTVFVPERAPAAAETHRVEPGETAGGNTVGAGGLEAGPSPGLPTDEAITEVLETRPPPLAQIRPGIVVAPDPTGAAPVRPRPQTAAYKYEDEASEPQTNLSVPQPEFIAANEGSTDPMWRPSAQTERAASARPEVGAPVMAVGDTAGWIGDAHSLRPNPPPPYADPASGPLALESPAPDMGGALSSRPRLDRSGYAPRHHMGRLLALAVAFGLTGGAVLWLWWPWQPDREISPQSQGSEAVARAEEPTAAVEPPRFEAEPGQEESASATPEPVYVMEPQPTSTSGSTPPGATALEPNKATALDPSPSEPERRPEREAPVDPESRPPSGPTAETPKSAKPSRKTKARPVKPSTRPGPKVVVAVELGFAAAMDFELDGVRSALTAETGRTLIFVAPGTVRVRWREPGAKWKSKTITIEPKTRYSVKVHPWGPFFEGRTVKR